MNLLAFDTSTEWMSIAVQRQDRAEPWQHTAAGGALTSTQLIPQIQALMAQAQLRYDQLDAIVFGAGPGSFTGLRTACSVAQGLAYGAQVPVLPVDTLLAMAEEARVQLGAADGLAVTALLDARMDEIYAASYGFDQGRWTRQAGCSLVKPEQLVRPDAGATGRTDARVLAGNVFVAYGARLHDQETPRITVLPSATALLRLAPALLAAGAAVPAEQALPTYIRDKVAQTTQERNALKSAGGTA